MMSFDDNDKMFDEAAALVEQGKYSEALPIWKQLYRAYPRDRDILYNSAVCLENVGRYDEGISLCNDLIEVYQDQRGYDMKARMQAARNMTGGGGGAGVPDSGGGDMPGLDLNKIDLGGLAIPGLDLGGGGQNAGGMPGMGPGMFDDIVGGQTRKTQPPAPVSTAKFNGKAIFFAAISIGIALLIGLAVILAYRMVSTELN